MPSSPDVSVTLTADAERMTADADLDAYIDAVVAAAPELTSEQLDKLKRVFRNS